jgi:molecular chaperone DnaJ
MAEDYYKILGLEKTATEAEIKRAYRKLAHQYHPDKGGGDAEKFKEVSQAYQVLSDPEKRKQYDQFGHTFDYESQASGTGEEGFDYSGFGFGGQQGVEFDFSNLGDIFDVFFGGGVGVREEHGRDIERRVTIDFIEAVKGADLPIELEKNVLCERCKGTRVEPGSKINTCPTCQGKGKVETVQSTILGHFKRAKLCDKCEGTGQIPERLCGQCQGKGIERKKISLTVKIPAGVREDMTIRVPGAGDTIKSGSSGDLYLIINIKKHPQFSRHGDDIYIEQEIKFSQAALGDKIAVPTVEGEKELHIPAGTQSGDELRLKNMGFPRLNFFGKGDEIIKIKVDIPKKLTHEQREIIEALKSHNG